MKRYRVYRIQFDSRGHLLREGINDERMIDGLTRQYGERAIEDKLENLRTIGGQAFSIVAYHNRFYKQAREAFVIGAYYPALTAACALGERILNELLLGLRESYRSTPEYKRVYNKEKFDNWDIMIDTLKAWDVLLPDAVDAFKKLRDIRHHQAIHFNPATAERDREFAIEALKQLDKIITVQFGGLGSQPWFIPDVAGAGYIRKDWESNPFVQLVYLPASVLVGPNHRVTNIDMGKGIWTFSDEDYEDREITDAEFVRLQEESTRRMFEEMPDEGEPVTAGANQ